MDGPEGREFLLLPANMQTIWIKKTDMVKRIMNE